MPLLFEFEYGLFRFGIGTDDDPELNVKMTFSTAVRAVLIAPGADGSGLLMLVMPVKI